jgi:(E)-4-hydroxy-3-methylbut-2-enyl-diphosphate synthase
LGATVVSGEIFEAFLGAFEDFKTFFHGHSYSGNQLGCAVARASLRLLQTAHDADRRAGLAAQLHARHPILLKDIFNCKASVLDAGVSQKRPTDFLEALLTASTNIGSLLCDGIGDAILVQGEEAPGQALRLSYNILQAAGSRIFKTDYVACPSCGRTLFNLQTTTAKIKAATSHLKGVKIAIMGCIVNGPGEMADADFGYVGGAPGKVNLYVGKTAVKFNIPEAEAVDRLKDLIREHGKWMEPARQEAALEPAS